MKNLFKVFLSAFVATILAIFLASPSLGGMKESGKEMEPKKMMEPEKMMSSGKTGIITSYEGHHASGTASITHDMGHAYLELTGIKVDKVPDGRVYLTKGGDHTTGVEVGLLKQFTGNVRFPIPDKVMTDEYDSVVIWCKKFDVGIGKATFKTGMMK